MSTTNIATSGLRFIRGTFRRLRYSPEPARFEVITIPINRCRHYGGYRYGSSAFNPYENYIVGLQRATDKFILRRRFEDFLRHFRPRTFGELLGVAFSNPVPLWVYPWDQQADPHGGWWSQPEDVTDIITQFSDKGIKRSRIDEEYFWLERAHDVMGREGYQPAAFSYIDVFELRHEGAHAFIVKDGNHRLSALAAQGHMDVVVTRDPRLVFDTRSSTDWAQVKDGGYTSADAVKLIEAYMSGVDGYSRSNQPAAILES